MVILLAILLLLVSPKAYTLEDQIEPGVLTLRTQNGSYRVLPGDDWGCGYVAANQNVEVSVLESGATVLLPESDGWSPYCTVQVLGQVDTIPCFTNEFGNCDVRVENGTDTGQY